MIKMFELNEGEGNTIPMFKAMKEMTNYKVDIS